MSFIWDTHILFFHSSLATILLYISLSACTHTVFYKHAGFFFSLLTEQCMIHLQGLSKCWLNNDSSHWPNLFYIAFLPSLYISSKLVLGPGFSTLAFAISVLSALHSWECLWKTLHSLSVLGRAPDVGFSVAQKPPGAWRMAILSYFPGATWKHWA